MLFLGLGIGLGSTLIVGGIVKLLDAGPPPSKYYDARYLVK